MSAGEITPQSLQFANAINEVANRDKIPSSETPSEQGDKIDLIGTMRNELATLHEQLAERDAEIARLKERSEQQRAERAEAELAETRRDLQFIERWANHHGQKPNITPREVLSMIQHYPPILEITRSYEDGKVPDTPNPWAELAKLRERLEIDPRHSIDGIAARDETIRLLEAEVARFKAHAKAMEEQLVDLIELAMFAMHGANADGAEFDIAADVQGARDALSAYRADFPEEK